MRSSIALAALAALIACGRLAVAQTPASAAAGEPDALSTCIRLADNGKKSEAAIVAKKTEAQFRQRVSNNVRDPEARVALARLLAQCILPSADFMQQGELSAESIDLLEEALAIKPDHWIARFVLANIADRSPPFLGRAKRAAQEYDELLRMQGNRNDNPMFARVFAARGRQLSRAGQVDSAKALWLRGFSLFPRDSELKKLVGDTSRVPASSSTLPAVKVVASAAPRVTAPSVKSVSRSDVLLTAGGTADVFQSVQMQPGATHVNEGGDVYTRGGDASETSLIVNGGRILSLGRFEGLSGSMFGALEPFVVKSVRYFSGGFSARYGNSLSGVVEIETDGRPREQQKRLGASLVQLGATLRSPFSSSAGGWINTRLSHTGALLRTHGRTDEFSEAPRSAEIASSVAINPTPLTELSATAIIEADESQQNISAAGWRGSFDSRGSKRAVILRSRWISGTSPLVLRANAALSSGSTDWKFGVLSRQRDESNTALRVDAEWEPAAGTVVRAGVEHGLQSREDDGTVPTSNNVAPDAPFARLTGTRYNAENTGSYLEAEKLTHGFAVTTGLRVDKLPGESSVTLDPRVGLSRESGRWTTRVGAGVFHQGRWRGDAAIPDAGTPSGLPGLARHIVLGIEYNREAALVRAEAFVKRYDNYRRYGEGPEIKNGESRGFDIFAQRSLGKLSGWATYSFLDAQAHLANGNEVPSAFDVTHSATGSLTAKVARDWSVGTTLRYATGLPYTPIIGGSFGETGRIEPVYAATMSARLPAYQRIDGRVMRYVRARPFLLTTFAEVLNVTGRRNVAAFTYDPTYTRRETTNTFFSQRTVVVGGELMFK